MDKFWRANSCGATPSIVNGVLSGWAQALTLNSYDGDGCVSLSGSGYGPSIPGGQNQSGSFDGAKQLSMGQRCGRMDKLQLRYRRSQPVKYLLNEQLQCASNLHRQYRDRERHYADPEPLAYEQSQPNFAELHVD